MMIDEEDKAQRLARAICADVMLYNAAVKDAPLQERAGLLSEPLREGRELYASRVSARLGWVFDAAVAELIAGPLGIPPPSSSAPRSPVQQPSLAAPVVPQSGGGSALIIAIAVFALVAGLAAFFFFF